MYLCGGEMDAEEFSLRITADNLDPDQITQLLGHRPTSSHRRGDSYRRQARNLNLPTWSEYGRA